MDFTKEYFSSLTSSWSTLQNTDKPIFIYGMGDGSLKIIENFNKYNIEYKGFFASDEFVRGQSFLSHKVQKLSDVENEYDDFIIVLAFACGYDSLITQIKSISNRHILIAPDTPVVGTEAFTKEYLFENFDSFKKVYDLFADDFSREVYLNTIAFKITGDITYLENIDTSELDCFNELIKPLDNEVFVDLGAYKGDTVEQFLNIVDNKFDKIIALEPNVKNYKKLQNFASDNIITLNSCVWSENTTLKFPKKAGRQSLISDEGIDVKAVTVDSLLNGDRASYIKYDVEGAENNALMGSINTIKTHKPKMKIAMYHRNEDLFKLPLLIHEYNPDYKLYFRKHPYIPAWEVNLFCI